MMGLKLTRQMERAVQQAAEILKKGGVCVIPTETSYGLAASIYDEEALARIYRIKKRPAEKPLLILVESMAQAPIERRQLTRCAINLMKRFWPGPLTLLLPAKEGLPFSLTGGTGRIGVRMSSHPVAQALVRRVGGPITATSANLSGMGLPKNLDEVRQQLVHESPDFFLDAGVISPGPASTILDATVEPPFVVRQGAVSLEDILAECERAPS